MPIILVNLCIFVVTKRKLSINLLKIVIMSRYSYLVIRSEFRKSLNGENSELISSRPIKAFSSRQKALYYLRNLSTNYKAKESCKVISLVTILNVHYPANSLGFSYDFEYRITSLQLE